MVGSLFCPGPGESAGNLLSLPGATTATHFTAEAWCL